MDYSEDEKLIEILPVNKLVGNNGQIKGVPANPRKINEGNYKKLLNSLQEDPEFLKHKPLHAYKLKDKYVVLCGNQRLKAVKELGYSRVPVTVYKEGTPFEIIKGRIIKDNVELGEYDWEAINDNWKEEPLEEWGVEVIKTDFGDIDSFFEDNETSDGEKHKTITCPSCGHTFEL